MHAAVVSEWGQLPAFKEIPAPEEPNDNEVSIKVIAVGIHQLVRSRAAGKHYSAKTLPHIPGVDGIGTSPSGRPVYFSCFYTPTGSLCEKINVPTQDVFEIPKLPGELEISKDSLLQVSAMLNPAMSSWMALTARAGIDSASPKPFTVVVLGATGVSGQAALTICRALGASKIVAVARNEEKLRALDSDERVVLKPVASKTDFSAAADADVVLDYLWGTTTQAAMPALLKERKNPAKRLTWVSIGSITGLEMPLTSVNLRSQNLAIVGSGPGSWGFDELRKEMPGLLKAARELRTELKVVKLEDAEKAWGENSEERLVIEI